MVSSEDFVQAAIRGRRDPNWWIKEFLGVDLWEIQRDIVQSVHDNKRTAVTACHAIGKSHLTACIAIWFICCHPDALVLLSAPTYRQVKEVLWREICSIVAQAPVELPGKLHSAPLWEIGEKWFMLGFSPQHPEKAQGFHAPFVLIILDEASGVSDLVMQSLRGVMASGHVRLLLLSNPTKTEGEIYRAFNAGKGLYKLFQVSAWDTPNLSPIKGECLDPATRPERRMEILRAAPLIRPYLIAPEFVADMEQEFGTISDVYRVRVLGQFPLGGENQLVPYHQAMEATYRWDNVNDSQRWWLNRKAVSGQVLAALDVARFGSNESVWCARLDTMAAPLSAWQGIDTVDLANNAASECRRLGVSHMLVDEDGLGGGPFDMIKRVVSASGFQGGSTRGVNTERFANARAQGYWGLRERYSEARIAHEFDDKLIGQLTALRYKHRASGQILIESKDEMVARGLKSPDRADALMMCYSKNSGIPLIRPGGSTTNWGAMHGGNS